MKQLKMTLWMLLCILTMTACGGDDDDLGYKGVAVEYSDVVGKTIFYSDLDNDKTCKLTFVDHENYKFKRVDFYNPYKNTEERGSYSLKRRRVIRNCE